jgi:hypothetical protein
LSKDLFPEEKRGQFEGYYLLYWVGNPMVLGPLTGSKLASQFRIPTTVDGLPGMIPTSLLIQVAGVMTSLAEYPCTSQREKENLQISATIYAFHSRILIIFCVLCLIAVSRT